MKLEKATWNLALLWASFRMIADLTRRAAAALATPTALAITFWILWNKH